MKYYPVAMNIVRISFTSVKAPYEKPTESLPIQREKWFLSEQDRLNMELDGRENMVLPTAR